MTGRMNIPEYNASKVFTRWQLFVVIFFFSVSTLFAQQPIKRTALEIPTITKCDVVVKHFGYTLSYNEKYEQANWVAYKLTDEETAKSVKRSNNFREDNAVRTGSAKNDDYKGSGYDRGHLAPAADMSWSRRAMEESFYYSNMSPQVPGFNRGVWKLLEEQVRRWAVENKVLYVVTGPILQHNLPTIGPDKVSIPYYYYKVILDYTKPELKGIGFILPNESSKMPLRTYAVSIDSVEEATGIDFFSSLPDDQESKIENSVCYECWSWNSTFSRTFIVQNIKDTATQCAGITKAGNRCKHMTSNSAGLCTQHLNQ